MKSCHLDIFLVNYQSLNVLHDIKDKEYTKLEVGGFIYNSILCRASSYTYPNSVVSIKVKRVLGVVWCKQLNPHTGLKVGGFIYNELLEYRKDRQRKNRFQRKPLFGGF